MGPTRTAATRGEGLPDRPHPPAIHPLSTGPCTAATHFARPAPSTPSRSLKGDTHDHHLAAPPPPWPPASQADSPRSPTGWNSAWTMRTTTAAPSPKAASPSCVTWLPSPTTPPPARRGRWPRSPAPIRTAAAAILRAVADLIETRPDIPEPSSRVGFYLYGEDAPAAMAAIASALPCQWQAGIRRSTSTSGCTWQRRPAADVIRGTQVASALPPPTCASRPGPGRSPSGSPPRAWPGWPGLPLEEVA